MWPAAGTNEVRNFAPRAWFNTMCGAKPCPARRDGGMIKKWLTVALAFAAILLPAEMVLARGGRGGGGGGRGGGRGGAGIGGNRGGNQRRDNKKRNRELLRERALAENRDAALRDVHADST